MIGELVCPDCGGVVGATERTEAGEPCRCFADASSASLSGGSIAGSSISGTAVGHTMGEGDPAVPATVAIKVCRACGKDLTGHKRFKDALGYLCPACNAEETKREHYGRVRCRVCGKLTLEEKLTDYEGTKMCPQCHGERDAVRRQQIQRIGFKGARTREELRHVYILLAIGGVLALIAGVGMLIHHAGH